MNRVTLACFCLLFFISAYCYAEIRSATAMISSVFYSEYYRSTHYSIKIGQFGFIANKKGTPCEGFFSGDKVHVDYDEVHMLLTKTAKSCELIITTSM